VPDALIIDACRTPRGIGKPERGALAPVHPQTLTALVLAAIAERNTLQTRDLDDVIWGTWMQSGTQSGNVARMGALTAGYDVTVSGMTVTRACGSGLTAANLAAATVLAGMADVVVAGGSEMMSSYQANGFTQEALLDRGNLALRARYPQTHQGVAADAIATLEGIDRAALDEFATESQRRAEEAQKQGYFHRSLVPVHASDGTLLLDRDECPRPGTTADRLATRPPAFDRMADQSLDEQGTTYRSLVLQNYPDLKIQHVHHAGNSSVNADGAAALLIASREYAKAHGLTPRARVVAVANTGGDPTLMLNAPVAAAQKVLAKAGLRVSDIDIFEINEAFAVVPEKFIRELGLVRGKVNVNGGAISYGHPVGATGAILLGTALDELERRDARYALVTMCTGGAMAPAVVIERCA
jgi:acetyl-CoA C-acetyltransferase